VGTKPRKYKAVARVPITEETTMYRFMRRCSMDRAILEEELRTEEEANAGPDSRERKYPLLRQARSMFAPVRLALARWRKMRDGAESRNEELGLQYIAELRIGPNEGFYYEKVGSGGHVSVWGEAPKLAAAVVRVVPGETMIEEA
jgi:hypothetical protein